MAVQFLSFLATAVGGMNGRLLAVPVLPSVQMRRLLRAGDEGESFCPCKKSILSCPAFSNSLCWLNWNNRQNVAALQREDNANFFLYVPEVQREAEHTGDLGYEPVAWRQATGHGGVGRGRHALGGLPALRGTSRWCHNFRQRPFQVRHARTSGGGGGIRLGVLRVQSPHSLLRQVRWASLPVASLFSDGVPANQQDIWVSVPVSVLYSHRSYERI